VGSIVVEPSQKLDKATLFVRGDEALQITNSDAEGVVYRGSLAATRNTFAVRMIAREPGTRGLRVRLSSPTPGADASLKVSIPGFAARDDGADAAEDAADTVTFTFHGTDIRQALLAVAQRGKVRIEFGPGIGGEAVNVELRDVPVAAALRILCEEVGYRLEGAGREFRVSKP